VLRGRLRLPRRHLDGDELGDGCDPEEAPVTIKSLVLRVSDIGHGRANGSGDFPVEALGPGDVLDTTDGLTIAVLAADDTPIASVQFGPGDCLPSPQGAIRCRTADRKSTARFKRRALAGGSVEMTYRYKLGSLDLPGPLDIDVRVKITTGWIDRVGAGGFCFLTTTGLRCVP
jgi:hypothetical protein